MTQGRYHVAIGDAGIGIVGRALDLHVRDSVLIVAPGTTHTAWIFREPLQGTVVEAVLTHNAGAIHIDGLRVRVEDGALLGRSNRTGQNGWKNSSGGPTRALTDPVAASGRWPPNVLFVHAPECCLAGTRRVKTSMGIRGSDQGNTKYGGGKGLQRAVVGQAVGYGDEDGLEAIAAWQCVPGCPVAALDAMSGDRKAGGGIATTRQGVGAGSYHGGGAGGAPWEGYGDAGPASRFYPQFATFGAAVAWLARLVDVG